VELKEIVTAVADFIGDDKAKAKELAKAIRDDAAAKPMAQELINVGSGLKAGELDSKIKKLEGELAVTTEKLTATETELGEVKGKTPDAKTIEERERQKHEPRIAKLTKERDDAVSASKALRRQVARDKLAAQLRKAEKGVRIDDADDLIISALLTQYEDRLIERDDGTADVLQIGEASAYDGKTFDEKVAALAADIRKKVPEKYLITGGDNGAGVGGDRGSGGGGGKWSDFRKELETEREKESAPGPSGAERFRGVSSRDRKEGTTAR
jgi:hypothetical protein